MSATSIEWTDVTWNPVRGCSRVSEGCRNCYAERMAARFSGTSLDLRRGEFHKHDEDRGKKLVQPFSGFASMTPAGPRWTGRVELIHERLGEPLRWRKPRRVFVNSMSDLFHEALDPDDIGRVFGVMAQCPQHTFQVLTKRADRMRLLMNERGNNTLKACASSWRAEWPLPNVWLGVSVEDQATADERIPLLLQTPAAVRFVSYEPALGPVDFAEHFSGAPEQTASREYVSRAMAADAGDPSMEGSLYRDEEWEQTMPRPDWVIVGGESGPGARPFDVAWARSAIRQCREAGVACFVKQLGRWPVGDVHDARQWHPKGGDPAEWPEDLRAREFPGMSASMKFDDFLARCAGDCVNGRSGDWSAYAAGIRAEAVDVNAGRVDAPEREASPPVPGKDPCLDCGCAPGCRCERISAESMMRSLEPDGGDR